jgi:osmoprotectant transport system permease protein
MLGGSLLIAALAIAVDSLLVLFRRLFLTRRAASTPHRSHQAAVDLTDPATAEAVVQGGTS